MISTFFRYTLTILIFSVLVNYLFLFTSLILLFHILFISLFIMNAFQEFILIMYRFYSFFFCTVPLIHHLYNPRVNHTTVCNLIYVLSKLATYRAYVSPHHKSQ